jgi:hypothetical protein
MDIGGRGREPASAANKRIYMRNFDKPFVIAIVNIIFYLSTRD